MCAKSMRGFTLLELVVTLIILAIAVGAIAGLIAQIGGSSASPVLQTQALYLAEGYLEEASLRSYSDPDGINEGCGVSRDLWDDVRDYACLATPAAPTDSTGAAMPGLSRYRISMTVGDPVLVGGANTRRIEVLVTHVDGRLNLRLATLRAEY